MTVEEEIKKIIGALHSADPARGIAGHSERIVSDLLSRKRYSLRQGRVTNNHGVEVNLQADVEQVINSSYYIGRSSNADAKFVSRWPQPTKDQRDSIARDCRNALEKLTKIYGFVPIDQPSWNAALQMLSESMVFGFTDSGEIEFAKFNASGLTGAKRYSFDDILPKHLLDREQTDIAKGLKESSYQDVAVKLLGKNPKPEYLKQKVDTLRRAEIVNSVPRRQLPQIPQSVLISEFQTREAIIRNIDPNVRGGNGLAVLQRSARNELQRLDDVSELKQSLEKIKPQPLAQWSGLPGYEQNF